MIRDANFICVGLDRQWIYDSELKRDLSYDFLQKMRYSVTDFNNRIDDVRGREDICYLILLVTWIKESYEQLEKLIEKRIKNGFEFRDKAKEEIASAFINALRSFVVAHPLGTDRHSELGLDGDYICVDIDPGPASVFMKAVGNAVKSQRFSLTGIGECCDVDNSDYRLYVYSKKAGAEFAQYLCCYYADLEYVANLYLKKLFAFDKYLKRLRKKDFF